MKDAEQAGRAAGTCPAETDPVHVDLQDLLRLRGAMLELSTALRDADRAFGKWRNQAAGVGLRGTYHSCRDAFLDAWDGGARTVYDLNAVVLTIRAAVLNEWGSLRAAVDVKMEGLEAKRNEQAKALADKFVGLAQEVASATRGPTLRVKTVGAGSGKEEA